MQEQYPLQEEDINNIEYYTTIKEFINCNMCLSILRNPNECTQCESIYCKGCIDEWLKRNKSCPLRCKDFKFKESRKLKNFLEQLEIICRECKEVYSFSNYYKHIESNKCPDYGLIKNDVLYEYGTTAIAI